MPHTAASNDDSPQPDIPSRGYTKLDSGILVSSIWVEPDDVLRVWIALLALADTLGRIRASVPGLAHVCRLNVERTREILKLLESPDPDSRLKTEDGRRIRSVD